MEPDETGDFIAPSAKKPCQQQTLENFLQKDMWSVVEVEEDFDCIPNSWFTALDKAYYYPIEFSSAVAKRMAKNHEAPHEDWPIVSVILKRRNYGSFDKGMEKATMYIRGKGSQSENDTKGVGLRKIKPLQKFSPVSTKGPKKSPRKVSPAKKACGSQIHSQRKQTIDKPVMRRLFSQENPPPKQSSSQAPHKVQPQARLKIQQQAPPTAQPQGPPNEQPQAPPNEQQQAPPKRTTLGSTHNQCKLKKKGLKHKCSFDHGPIDLENLAHSLCALARLFEGCLTEIIALKELLQAQNESEEEGDEIQSADEDQLKDRLPFYDFDKLLEFDEELADKELSSLLVHYLKGKVSTTNASICASSAAKMLISKSLCKQMVWKGSENCPKFGFENLRLKKIVTRVVQKKFRMTKSVLDETIKNAVGRWFTQTASNIKKGRTASDTPKKAAEPGTLEQEGGSSTRESSPRVTQQKSGETPEGDTNSQSIFYMDVSEASDTD